MLHVILAESALEIIPMQLWRHPSVVNRAKTLRKKPGDMLLDRSYHHRAMLRLSRATKRGRPDIVHFCLLEALATPLNKEGLLKVYVHTIDNHIIAINPKTRLPRNYNRFVGLIEQLYKTGQVPVNGDPLLKVRRGRLQEIIAEIQPSHTLVLSRNGEPKTLQKAMKLFSDLKAPSIIVGAFPRGQFSNEIMELSDFSVSIDPEMLEAWTITARTIYEFEKLIGLPEMRCKKIGRVDRGERAERPP